MDNINNKKRQDITQKVTGKKHALYKEANEEVSAHDVIFFSMLRRKKRAEVQEKTFEKRWIYRRMRIFSLTPLEIPVVKYYKFPFSSSIKNDSSSIFKMLYAEWIKAAHSAYLNFKNHTNSFYLKLERCILCFENDALWISENFRSTLERNEIEYSDREGWLCVDMSEANIVFDLVANFPVGINSEMPFIISRHEFCNSSLYYTKINKKPAVRYRSTTQYHYEIDSYFIGADYSGFFMYNVDIESII